MGSEAVDSALRGVDLTLALAIVLVVLAALGYLGRAKVEVVDIVQPTATAVAGATGAVKELLLESGGSRVGKRVGIIACEVALA